MIRKLTVLAVVAAALVAADLAARGFAEAKLGEQAAAYYPQSGRSSAAIESFPFLGRLAVSGQVPRVSLRLEDLVAQALTVRRLDFHLSDVKLDRSELAAGRVRVLDIGAGRIEALFDGASLARAVGVDMRFGDGEVEVHRTVGGADVSARGRVTLEGNRLRIEPTSAAGLRLPASAFTVSYDIPGVELLPCEASVRAVPEGLLAGCAVDDIPAVLVPGAAATGAPSRR